MPGKRKRPTARQKILAALKKHPELGSLTNAEIAWRLAIPSPLTVSHTFSLLHQEGVVRVWFDGELTPVRHVDLIKG